MMKVLELRFKNLNSLYGEWTIDFTDPEYVSNGIFALTGPTGAGKSTILDAICLALYGATPRLGKITGSGNEIMSRQTGECYAEVLFESQAGRFRCHWEQRRARKKAEGRLQDQEHLIADADTGKPIETKKSRVGGVIEEKTGMDFERFTRSILLAQGGFDTFLRADAEHKSRILEQMTGTAIYSEISCRVHERQRDEREKLNLLRAETSGIVVLEPEQERALHRELETTQKQESELARQSVETTEAITWLTTMAGLKKELLSLSDEAKKLQEDTDAFHPERTRLELAERAASLDGTHATLTAIRKQQADDQAALKSVETTLPALEASAQTQTKALEVAEQYTLKAKENLKTAAPLIQKIRSLDQTISEQARAVTAGVESHAREAEKIEQDRQARVEQQKKRTDAQRKLETADHFLKTHAQDEWLIGGLAGVEEQLGNLLARQRDITQREADIQHADSVMTDASKSVDASTKKCLAQSQELKDTSKRLQQSKDALGELLGDKILREYRTEKETLLREMAFIKKIEELEDHRTRLEDGKPCPLCGSTEHPYAAGNIPAPDETEQKIASLSSLITRAEDQESIIKKQEEAEAAARKRLNDSEHLKTLAIHAKEVAEKKHSELKNDLFILRTGFEELKLAVSGKLQPLGINEIPESKISALLESLKSRLKAWQGQVTKKGEIEKQMAGIDGEMKRLDAVIETQSQALTQKQEQLEQLKSEHATLVDERKSMYGDKLPDDEESRLNQAIADAEKAEMNTRSLNDDLKQKLITARSHVESLKSRIDQRASELEKAETDFSAALSPAGFSDEPGFLQARLTHEERESLSSRARELEHAATQLKARQADRETRLATEKARKLTEKTLEALEPQSRELEESLKQLRDTMATLKHKLQENEAGNARIKDKQIAIEAQKKECHRWEKLHSLIGSADGKKYRTFAQGLTFELMVSHANRQLEQMTDRYLLIRDTQQPLELNVVDHYQAGEIRSTRNLSGGESFIVSLTLALGLSKMASRKVRVDSLFLDEGFGTLDEQALETALQALSGLQQDGKLIGIISHVSALEERISTQIHITPRSGGRSSITGPGCHAAGNPPQSSPCGPSVAAAGRTRRRCE